ncbi:MAG: DUF1611 domain-containing protein [Sphingomonadaceae bacterium]
MPEKISHQPGITAPLTRSLSSNHHGRHEKMLYEDIGFASSSEHSDGSEQHAEAGSVNALAQRLANARRAFTTRNVDLSLVAGLDREGAPKAGDLVLARVVSIGHHTKLESPEGRRQAMYPGDEIIVAYGHRYAPDQFEAKVPGSLAECDLVAGGGIASAMLAKHSKTRNPTRIQPIGLLRDWMGRRVNLSAFATCRPSPVRSRIAARVIVVVGTSMNAGKTTTAAKLIHGLRLAGLRVGAAKVTGTGSGGDIWSMLDAGARTAVDFTDAGHASTAGVPLHDLAKVSLALVGHAAKGNDVAVIEVADGLFQEETAGLLQCADFTDAVDGVILAAGDAMGAAYGHRWLSDNGLPISLIAGCVSSSPLGLRETESATGLKVATLEELANGELAPSFCFADAPLAAA